MMFNPWVLLALVVFWLASVGTAGYEGADWQKGRDAKAQLEAVNQAVSDANEQSQKDKNLAVIQAQRNTAAQTRAAMLRSQVNATIATHQQPIACDWDAPTFVLLASAIQSANGDEAADAGLSDRVRKANAASEQQSGRGTGLDLRPDRPVRRVPKDAR